MYLTRATGGDSFEKVAARDIKSIAQRTAGMTISNLRHVVELAVSAADREGRKATGSDLLTALEEYMFGARRNKEKDSYRNTAYHEAGHAYVSWVSGEKPSYVTIESRGYFGGYMAPGFDEDRTTISRDDLIWSIRTALAGRASGWSAPGPRAF